MRAGVEGLPVAAMLVQRVGSVSERNPNSGSFAGRASWIWMLLKLKLINYCSIHNIFHHLKKWRLTTSELIFCIYHWEVLSNS